MKIFPKKSLGQNFLKSEGALNTIIQSGRIQENDLILEIGPGQGALTEKLLASGVKVLAIEKDLRLISFLKNKFSEEVKTNQLTILEQDVLDFDPDQNLKKYKIIANIPYYITGAIIRKFLSANNQPERMVLLVQKEVAQRIIARDQKESLLSISIKIYCEPKIEKIVSAGSFVPAPKVDSAIISFENISKNSFLKNEINEKNFFEILHLGFAHKRKILKKNLEPFLKKNEIEKILKKLKIDSKIRAEDLSLENWIEITKEVKVKN